MKIAAGTSKRTHDRNMAATHTFAATRIGARVSPARTSRRPCRASASSPAPSSSAETSNDEAVAIQTCKMKGTSRRGFLSSALATSALCLTSAAPALAAGNDAVLAALKAKESADLVEGGAVQTRLNTALDELRRARQLASVGEYTNARQMLRKGALESVRGDLQKVGNYLRVQRPTFAEFEGLAVTGGLDAFDGSMRAMEVGAKEVTATDVNTNAKAAVSALEEVVYLLGRDRTYQAQKEKLMGGPVVKGTDGEVAGTRRDFLAEEEMIIKDSTFTESWMTDGK